MLNIRNYPIYDNSYPKFKTRAGRPIISNYKEEIITNIRDCLDYNNINSLTSYYFKKMTIKNPVFVNVGAGYSGKAEKELLSIYPNAKIINIEPQIIQIKKLEENIKDIRDSIIIENAALVNDNYMFNTIELYGSGESANVLRKDNYKKQVVKAIKLKDIIEKHNIKTIDVLLINAEGIEIDLLNNICSNVLYSNIINQINVNYHTHVREFNITSKTVRKSKKQLLKYYKLCEARIHIAPEAYPTVLFYK